MGLKQRTVNEFKCDGPGCKEVKETRITDEDTHSYRYRDVRLPPGWVKAAVGNDHDDSYFHNTSCLKKYADDKMTKNKKAAEKRKTTRKKTTAKKTTAKGITHRPGRRKSTRQSSRRTTRKRRGGW